MLCSHSRWLWEDLGLGVVGPAAVEHGQGQPHAKGEASAYKRGLSAGLAAPSEPGEAAGGVKLHLSHKMQQENTLLLSAPSSTIPHCQLQLSHISFCGYIKYLGLYGQSPIGGHMYLCGFQSLDIRKKMLQ